MDSMWSQANYPTQPTQQWLSNPQSTVPTSLWDLHGPQQVITPVQTPTSVAAGQQQVSIAPTITPVSLAHSTQQLQQHQENAAKERERERKEEERR